jgi:hypothetical protein
MVQLDGSMGMHLGINGNSVVDGKGTGVLLIGDKLRRAVQGFFDRINSIFGLSLQDSRLHL